MVHFRTSKSDRTPWPSQSVASNPASRRKAAADSAKRSPWPSKYSTMALFLRVTSHFNSRVAIDVVLSGCAETQVP